LTPGRRRRSSAERKKVGKKGAVRNGQQKEKPEIVLHKIRQVSR
jgi:hypothetical protein